MTRMQRQAGVQSSLLSDGDCFDMWHDYMDLGRLLQRLCNRREDEHRGTSSPRSSSDRSCSGTSSPSRSSDTSCSGTSSLSSPDLCRFCQQNGESAKVYQSHKLKSDDGKVVCPILWNYTCPMCKATGERAHTRRYCPKVRLQEAARKQPVSRFW